MTSAQRILVTAPNSSQYGPPWDAPDVAVKRALEALKDSHLLLATDPSPPYRLLVVERWQRILIVFDIGNDAYDPDTAHLPGENDLPVWVVHLRATTTAMAASASMTAQVNTQVRQSHDDFGIGSRPPFFVDHANGHVPTFWNPRSLVRHKPEKNAEVEDASATEN